MTVALLFGLIILLMTIGVPVAVSLGLSSILFLVLHSDGSLASIAQTLFSAFDGHYTLLAIPFFILASTFMSTGGVARRIIRFAIALVGHIKGGLAIASVVACMMFAALSGSSPATVIAIGSIVIAGMREVGYSKEFAAGVICNAGTLGILIPPSIVMVVYAAATDVSVGPHVPRRHPARHRRRADADGGDLRDRARPRPAVATVGRGGASCSSPGATRSGACC